MKIIQKTNHENEEHLFFHSVGKWFLLIKYDGYFDTQLAYDWPEDQFVKEPPFKVTAEKDVNNVNDIGKIHYASFKSDDGEIVLLGIADVTLIAREDPLQVTIEENHFDHFFNSYQKQYEVNEERVDVNLPEDDVTRIVMLIDEFYDLADAEYHFGTPRDMHFFQELSENGTLIRSGNVDSLIEHFQTWVKCEEHIDDDHVKRARNIISELTRYKKKD